jgi:hypothetical protein
VVEMARMSLGRAVCQVRTAPQMVVLAKSLVRQSTVGYLAVESKIRFVEYDVLNTESSVLGCERS